jgi:hypothetical protein
LPGGELSRGTAVGACGIGHVRRDADAQEVAVQVPPREQNIVRIVEALAERFRDQIDRATIESEVRARYDHLCAESAFDDFVPILAARLSLEDLRADAVPESAADVAARLTATAGGAAEQGADPSRAGASPDPDVPAPSIPLTGR